jgi:translation elongation factor P/translation initiation factor 5A
MKSKKLSKYLALIILIVVSIIFNSDIKLEALFIEEDPLKLLEKSHQDIVLTVKKDFSEIMNFEDDKVKYKASTDDGLIFITNGEEYFAKIDLEELEYTGIEKVYSNYQIVYTKF